MALKSTIHRAELQVSDLDRHYYASHRLTLAQHPSENDRRLMARLLAFALFADERLAFGRGISTDDEPDLWRTSMGGEIEQWIDLGQPDESRIRKACGRAREVVVIGYAGRPFSIWWEKSAADLARFSNLRVVEFPGESVEASEALLSRNMDLQCLIEDGEIQLLAESGNVTLKPTLLQGESLQPTA